MLIFPAFSFTTKLLTQLLLGLFGVLLVLLPVLLFLTLLISILSSIGTVVSFLGLLFLMVSIPFFVLANAVLSFESGVISLAHFAVYSIIPLFQSSIAPNKVQPLLSHTISIASCRSLASFIRSIPVRSLIFNARLRASELVVVPLARRFIASSQRFPTSASEALKTLFKLSFSLMSSLICFTISPYSGGS